MKKLTTLIFLGILLVGIVGAGVLSIRNRTIEINQEGYSILQSKNLTNYQTWENRLGEDIERCLFKENIIITTETEIDEEGKEIIMERVRKEGVINKCRVFKGDNQIERDEWELKALNKIISADKSRSEREKIVEGETEVKLE